jgi:hypothetical protein
VSFHISNGAVVQFYFHHERHVPGAAGFLALQLEHDLDQRFGGFLRLAGVVIDVDHGAAFLWSFINSRYSQVQHEAAQIRGEDNHARSVFGFDHTDR